MNILYIIPIAYLSTLVLVFIIGSFTGGWISDDGFFTELNDAKMVYITGRLSSGKTLLGVKIAEYFLKKGYGYISTILCVWNDDPATILMNEVGHRRCVIHVDEVGLYFRTQKSASSVASFAAKQDCILLFTGKKAPHKDLCDLTLILRFNFYKWLLIPLHLWRYDVNNGNQTYSVHVLEWAWWEYFGIYNTVHPGSNPTKLVETVKLWTEEFFTRWGESYEISDVETGGGNELTEFSNELAESTRAMGQAAKSIASASRSKTRR